MLTPVAEATVHQHCLFSVAKILLLQTQNKFIMVHNQNFMK